MKILNNLRNAPYLIWFSFLFASMKGIQHDIRKDRARGDFEKELAGIRKAEDVWGQAICKKVGIDIRVKGIENVPDGPVVFVSNHQSYWDIPVFFTAIPDKAIGFVAKDDLTKVPALSAWILDVRGVYIERDDLRATLKAFDQADGVSFSRDFPWSIFPEGTRSRKIRDRRI